MTGKLVTFRVADIGFPKGVSTEEAIDMHHAADVSTGLSIIILKLADLAFAKGTTTGKIRLASQVISRYVQDSNDSYSSNKSYR